MIGFYFKIDVPESNNSDENTPFADAGDDETVSIPKDKDVYKRQKYNCALKRLDFQQEEGLMSSLPIGINQVEIERGLTTSSTAVFVPFTTQELFQGGESLYYGLNALSNNCLLYTSRCV